MNWWRRYRLASAYRRIARMLPDDATRGPWLGGMEIRHDDGSLTRVEVFVTRVAL